MAKNLPFFVIVKETLKREVQVSANSAEAAELLVKRAYQAEEIVLGAEDYTDTEFIVCSQGGNN